MATINERNQQILGILSLAQGASRLFGPTSSTSEKLRNRQPDNPAIASGAAKIIEETRAGIRKWGIEKPSLTYVGFTPPPSLNKRSTDASYILRNLVSLRAENVVTPGVQLATTGIRRYGAGPIERIAYSAAFNDIQVSFIGDARGIIHQFFYFWMRSIVGFHDLPRWSASNDPLHEFKPYQVGYRQDYSTTIDIITYDEIQEKIGTVKLYNAYPVALGELTRSWANINDLVRIPITFTYTHWSYSDQLNLQLIEPSLVTPAEQNKSLLGDVYKTMTALQTITAIKRPQNINDILNTVNTGSTLLRQFFPASRITY